ncbi:MAG TPA: hypothetical protein VHL59_19065 [Thermoanaerobaculia bacterium]|nr:hypothetical protein [Thermoanaerobaculia bacterium]
MDSEIYHCVFTHAKDGRSGTGGRFLQMDADAAQLLPAEANRELRALLEKLQPESGEPAFAMRRFAAGKRRFACFAVSYGGFEDAAGRDGLLNHARVVELDEEAIWLDPLPLVSLAEAFPIDAVRAAEPIDRLQAYIERIRNEVVTVVPLTRQALQALPREHLGQVLRDALGAIGDARKRHRVPAPEIPLTQLARSWAALPVGLQRQSAWAFAAKEGLPVPLTWSASATADKPSDAATRAAEQYLALLLDSTHDVTPLVRDENLDLGAFAQRLQRAETMEMPKKTHKPEPRGPELRPEPRPIEGQGVVDLNRQYDRMFAALKEYVDLRLEGHDAARAAAKSARGGELVPARGAGWMQMLRRYGAAVGLLAGILLTLGVLMATGKLQLRNRDDAAPVRQESPETASVQEDPQESGAPPILPAASDNLRTLVRDAALSKKWAEAFRSLTASEPEAVAALIEKAIQDDATGPADRRKLADLQDRLRGRGPKLESTDRAVLRDYLMQYIATQVTTETIVIDDKLTDLGPAVMNRLRDETAAASEATQPSDDELQGEIILRWMEKHPS